MMFDYTVQQAVEEMTGFDALEIKRVFHAPLSELDGEIKAVAIYYIHAKRADPNVTYKDVMSLSFATLSSAFKPDDASFPGGDGPGA